MALPEKYHLDALRKLRGDAHVTFPGGSTSVVKVERVYSVSRGTALPAFLTADEEYTSAKLVEQQVIGGDANQVEVYRLFHTLPGVATSRYAVDEETRGVITITTQLVETPTAGDVAGLNGPGTQVEFQPINSVYGTLITTLYGDGENPPDNREEYRLMDYTFPALLFSVVGAGGLEGRDGTARTSVVSTRRAAFTRQALGKITISYGTKDDLEHALIPSDPGYANFFQPKLNDIIYNGIAFDINERNVLNNPIGPISFTSGTDNPKWPFFVEVFPNPATPDIPFSATTPSADEYVSDYIGTYRFITGTLRPWRYGWWRLELLAVLMQ